MVGAPVLPGVDEGWGEAVAIVDEVAEDDEFLRLCEGEQAREALKIRAIRAVGHGDAAGSEAGGLSEVEVSDKENALTFPPYGGL